MSQVVPVILSGGAGTRLWPLSTPAVPKQFLRLVGENSLFDSTVKRMSAVPGVERVIVVTGVAHRHLTETSLSGLGVPWTIVTEPVGRNTAPAATAAALLALPEDLLLICPSDHAVTDEPAFVRAVESAAELAQNGRLVTLGVVPTRAETGYGYIELGAEIEHGHEIRSFVEKPSKEVASTIAFDGRHLWNAGMFVCRAGVLLDEIERHAPRVLATVTRAFGDSSDELIHFGSEFADAPSISLDYAVMEKTDRGAVVALDAGWSDVGSYESLYELSPSDSSGNTTFGEVRLLDATNNLVRAESRRVTVVGAEGLVVIETPNEVLVVPRARAQEIRGVQTVVEDG